MLLQGPRLLLDNSANNFERAAVDSFLLKKHKKLGRLTAIRIGHDNKGMCAGTATSLLDKTDQTVIILAFLMSLLEFNG